jgi:predicted outer membrane repeat protein
MYLNNAVVNANVAGSGSGLGGAAYLEGDAAKLNVLLCTIVGNSAKNSGGAIYVDGQKFTTVGAIAGTTEVTIEGSIVWNNLDARKYWLGGSARRPGFIHQAYCDIGSDVDTEPVPVPELGEGNKRINPGFLPVSQQPGGVLYILDPNSPCKGAARRYYIYRPNVQVAMPQLPWCQDIAGGRRLGGDRPDMGAYEVQDPSPPEFAYCTYGLTATY